MIVDLRTTDGLPWSQIELTNPNWRIVRVSGLLQTEIDALLALGAGDPKLQSIKRRKFKVDFTKLPTAIQNALLAPRTTPILTVSGTNLKSATVLT